MNKEKLHIIRRESIVIGKVLAPVVFVVILGIYDNEFVINAVSANIAINLGIVATAIYGITLILARLLSAQADFRVIERFGKEALEGKYMTQLLEEPWLKHRYVRHYLAHIAQTGGTISSQLDQNAIESELHALQGEYESKLELPQFLVGFMIAMGLLGTFIGLLTTLTGIAGMLDGLGASGGDIEAQFGKLVGELHKPLAGMGIAFSASMFGLIGSLMLAIMMTNLRRYINRVMAIARNVMHNLVELGRPVTGAKTVSTTALIESEGYRFDSGGAAAGSAAAAGSNLAVASRIELLVKKIDLLMQLFEVSINNSQKLTDLLGFGPRMQEISERTLEEIKSLGFASGEQQRLSQKIIDTNSELLRTMGNVFEIQRQTKEVGDTISEGIRTMGSFQSEQNRLCQKLIDISNSMSAMMDSNVDAQRLSNEIGEKGLVGLNSVLQGQEAQGRLVQKLIDMQAITVRVAESTLEQQRVLSATHESSLSETRSIVALGTEQRQLGRSMLEGLEYGSRTADASLTAQKQSFSEMVQLLRNVEERLAKAEDVGLGGARHLSSIKESLTKLCQAFGVIDLLSAGVGQQTLLLETLIDETKNSQKGLYAIQQELRRDIV